MGIEFNIKHGFYFQATLEYSRHLYDGLAAAGELMERGTSKVVDFMGSMKKRWDWFYLTGGLGFSFQTSENSYISGKYDGQSFRHIIYIGSSSNVITGSLGFGFNINTGKRIEIFLEGTLRIRKYVTPVCEIGIIYNL